MKRHNSGLVFLVPVLAVLLAPAMVLGAEYSPVEARIVVLVKEIYPDGDNVQVRVDPVPPQLREKIRVRNVSFVKIPDVNGDGICSVEYEAVKGKTKSAQVPFKVFTKRKLFSLKEGGKKGDEIKKENLTIRETYLHGKGSEYPFSLDDLMGRCLRRDVAANTIITNQLIEDRIAVQRGAVVDIVAQNKQLSVITKGKMLEKGKLGDAVRVKNIASGREIVGRVVAHNAVAVDF